MTKMKWYSVRTDGATQEIEAMSEDKAAEEFASDEFPKAKIRTADQLINYVESLGGWCSIKDFEQ